MISPSLSDPYCVIPIAAILFFLSFAGCSTNVENDLPCSDPAPLHGSPSEEAEGVFVIYQGDREWSEDEIETTTNELASKYGFDVRSTYRYVLQGFGVNQLSAEALGGLRCESVVEYVSYNAKVEAF